MEKTAHIKVRWADVSDVVAISRFDAEFGESLWKESLLRQLITKKQQDVVLLAFEGSKLVGFLIYEVRQKKFSIITFVVRPGYLPSAGRNLTAEVADALAAMGKEKITYEIRESDLTLQLFFREVSYKCYRIVRGWYRDYTGDGRVVLEDAYKFRYLRESKCL